jgi:hypothetical protein
LEGTREFFNLIIDIVVHAQDGTLQPQLVTPAKLRMMMSNEHPVAGLECPVNLPSQELMRIVTPHIFLQGKFLVYVLYVPLLLPYQYQLYKIIPFPSPGQGAKTATHLYLETTKDFIISDSLRQNYPKLSQYQLDGCFEINDIEAICKETEPILTYKAGEDCEAT